MSKKGFTLIELLAVIVILAIIALIATPIIIGIISDARKESQERSLELYVDAIKNGILAYELRTGIPVKPGIYTSSGKSITNGESIITLDYEGNVECEVINITEEGRVTVDKCKVNGVEVESKKDEETPTPVSFATDEWSTIVANLNSDVYKVGDTREITLDGFTNHEKDENGKDMETYTIRIANTSTPSECSNEGFSQTACGFVIEFEDIILEHKMNETNTNAGGYPASLMYTYIQNDIYNVLPDDLKDAIIPTFVVSGHGSTSGEENFVTEQDKLYLLSGKEVCGSDSNDTSSGLTRQLDYYKDVAKVTTSSYSGAIKTLDGTNCYWWLRSAYSNYTGIFHNVFSNGFLDGSYAGSAYGVAVAFRIG